MSDQIADHMTDLRPYQTEGVSFLVRQESALLADEMGLGKTVQAIIAIRILLRAAEFNRVLIVTPASLRLNWQREIARWAPELTVRRADGSAADRMAVYHLPVDVLIVSYEQIRIDGIKFQSNVKFDLVVLDEAQRIKHAGSDTSLACRLINRGRSWALSGTPLENRVDDLVSIFKFLKPGLLPNHSGRPEIHDAIKRHFLRRRKADVLCDLPPIIYQDLTLELQGPQQCAYQELWDSRQSLARSEGLPVGEINMLALITKLKLICNFDVLGNSIKLDMLSVILESMVGAEDKLIVFSQFVGTLEQISDGINGFQHDLYHGGLSEAERDDVLYAFENNPGPRVLLISLKAGGVGLNLNSASSVVLFDRWWNPAMEDQAIQRAHRFGKSKPLHVVRFLVSNTIEERIDTILRDKRQLFDEYVNGAPSEVSRGLTREDLRRVLGLTHLDIDKVS